MEDSQLSGLASPGEPGEPYFVTLCAECSKETFLSVCPICRSWRRECHDEHDCEV